MKDRRQSLIAIRPNIDAIDKSLNTKELEGFQNDVLRPILKFQNDLLLYLFTDYAKQYKGVFFKLADQEQADYIQKALNTNQRFKSKVIGTVIGLFTIEDYSFYRLNLSALNKRIITMTIQRLQDQIHALNNGLSV